MAQPVIGLMSPGDMGHSVGGEIRKQGFRVVTSTTGRSALTKTRAERVGLEDVGSLAKIVEASDVILSIMPPESAEAFATDIAAEVKKQGKSPVFVDCNAISPVTMKRIDAIIRGAGAKCMDAGIVGSPPGSGRIKPKIYVSGPHVDAVGFFNSETMTLMDMGPEIGRPSALKMCYAGLTKGTNALRTAVLLSGEMLGVGPELKSALADSQGPQWQQINAVVPFLACRALVGRDGADRRNLRLGRRYRQNPQRSGRAVSFSRFDAFGGRDARERGSQPYPRSNAGHLWRHDTRTQSSGVKRHSSWDMLTGL